MNGFMFGDGRRKRWLRISTWVCKHDGRSFCPCCAPKNAIPPMAARAPGMREYFTPRETGKTRIPKRR